MRHALRVRRHAEDGFTLTELMIVITILAVLAGMALPKLLRSRLTANESAAISLLKSISSAQAQLQSRNAIDTDADGAGEYGYLGELSGTAPTRISLGGAPAAGAAGIDELDPSVVAVSMGDVQPDGTGSGVVVRSGYVFKMFLPGGVAGPGIVPGIPEDPAGGAQAGSLPDSNTGESLWACYAWPMDASRSGNRVFFINHDGELLSYHNRDSDYSGIVTPGTIPSFDAALSSNAAAGTLTAPPAVAGVLGQDGNVWTEVQ